MLLVTFLIYLQTQFWWQAVALQSSFFYCFFTFWRLDDVIALSIYCAMITMTLLCFSLIVYSYHALVTMYLSAKKKEKLDMLQIGSTKSSPPPSPLDLGLSALSRMERKLLFKSIAITLSFLLSYAPYILKIICEMALGGPVSPLFDSFAAGFALLNSCFNGAVLLFFDGRVRAVLWKLYGCGYWLPLFNRVFVGLGLGDRGAMVEAVRVNGNATTRMTTPHTAKPFVIGAPRNVAVDDTIRIART